MIEKTTTEYVIARMISRGWESWDKFRLIVFKDGAEFTKMVVPTDTLDWARPARGRSRSSTATIR